MKISMVIFGGDEKRQFACVLEKIRLREKKTELFPKKGITYLLLNFMLSEEKRNEEGRRPRPHEWTYKVRSLSRTGRSLGISCRKRQ